MLLRLAHRLTVTCYVALSLLFSQLALANYVCPQEQDMAAMAEMVASGTPCEGMDMDQPALCAEHSSNTPQSFEPIKLPTLAPALVVSILELTFDVGDDGRLTASVTTPAEDRPPPDPLFLSTLRLRV
ncbi:hypothetical protein ACNI65_21905 [Roseateles sp. So40a]|uniref:hypothetical protein n=1 Tax=Roseateles sp. So40a TaxID=3400226 RepID=UPI003A86657A